jgi:hypothetical protein
VESAQNPLVKKDCAVIPIKLQPEGEKQRKSAQGNIAGIIPITPFFGTSNVISLHTHKTPDIAARFGGFPKGMCQFTLQV